MRISDVVKRRAIKPAILKIIAANSYVAGLREQTIAVNFDSSLAVRMQKLVIDEGQIARGTGVTADQDEKIELRRSRIGGRQSHRRPLQRAIAQRGITHIVEKEQGRVTVGVWID